MRKKKASNKLEGKNRRVNKHCLAFLEKNKGLVGLSDWSIYLNSKLVSHVIAESQPDTFEKRVYISLSIEFYKKPRKDQENVLLHELIHSRVLIMKKLIEERLMIEEEHLVNDITRGFEKVR